ncbi:MAG TPA: adenylate/guanylate cyclase domain-containing protein, partial [Gemmatimonadales bacterium]|nr:adenylate/guanylate cyclase domain-containing protein [Gemmatimonadales bacterium]
MDDTTRPSPSSRLRFLERWAPPTDAPEERLQAVALAGTAMLISVLSIWWVGMYWYLGVPRAAAFPFAYQVISVASLAYFARTKNIPLFRRSQLLMWLLLPLGLQWTLGGFVNASAVMLWSIFAPLGALLFQGPRRAAPWLAAYGAAIFGMGLAEVALHPAIPPLPGWFIVVNFVMNLTAISFVAFAMLRYFALKREEATAALHREHRLLQDEEARSRALLLNVLPEPIADRLKRRPAAIADGFTEATVLFADIVEFTRISAGMRPEDLVAWLNDLFSVFDRLSERHGLEKIKTVGDAYMAASGVPMPRPDHAQAAAEMALEMQDEVRRRKAPNGEPLQMRSGLHSGPVVAGVIGTRKFIYDLWGDTVNTAS